LIPDVLERRQQQAGVMTDNTETTTELGPALGPAPRPPLRRSPDRVLAGVAGGIGRWLGIDPVIVRVVLVVLAVFGGSGLLLYLVGWLFIPDEGTTASQADRFIARGQRPGSTTRIVLIVIGVVLGAIFAVNLLSAGPFHTAWGFGGGGSFLLILAIVALVLWLVNRDQSGTLPTPPDSGAVPASDPPTQPVGADDTSTRTLPAGYAYGGPGNYPGYIAPAAIPVAPRPPRVRSYLGLATLSLALIAMGTLGSLALTGLANIPVVVVLAGGLAALGVGLLIGSVFGRARWLVALAIPLLMVTALVALFPANVRLPKNVTVGDQSWSPTTIVEASSPHALTLGDAVLDLTELTVPAGTTTPVSAEVGIGQLTVKVPPGMRVQVTATAGTGEVRIDGLPVRSGQNVTVATELPGFVAPNAPTVVLDAQVGIGSLEVSRA
jgi:phage shock protein PspC (stress-responsive transcriptional regulator)